MLTIFSVFRSCLNPVILVHFLIVLTFPLRIATETSLTEFVTAKANTGDGQVCGTVTTSSGTKVELREGVTLSESEFEKVHRMKLKGAIFSPDIERKCVIKVCGFTSFTSRPPQYGNSTYIGSISDYADCELITKNETASTTIYNDVFNTSSIGCACSKNSGDCILNCFERHIDWKENECAVLFQESFCKNCDFNFIPIETKKEFITDNTHHIRSALVRENCSLSQNITGLNRIWRFQNESTTLQYSSTPTASNVKSSFLSDPEIFWCYCNGDSNIVLPEPEPTKVPTLVYIVISLSSIVGIGGLSALIFMWQRGNMACGSIMKKRGSDDSTTTHTTDASRTESWDSLDYSQIVNSPYDTRFDIAKSQFQSDPTQLLGGGHFGEVFKGSLDIAIKSCKVGAKQMCFNSLQQEIKILSHLGIHENVVRFYGYCAHDYKNGELYLITELCEKGCLKSYLQNTIQPRLSNIMMERQRIFMDVSDDGYTEEPIIETINFDIQESLRDLDSPTMHQFLQWAEEIANGMNYITHRKIVHVDLAARNVLLNHNLTAKIGDFGLSRKIYIKDYEDSKKESLPIMWVAPEALMENKYSSKSDTWSYGVTIWEIFSIGKEPYTDKSSFFGEILGALMKGERLERPQYAPDDVYSKLCECWNLIPEKRPSFKNLRDFFSTRKRSVPIPIPTTILTGMSDTSSDDKVPHVIYTDMQISNL